MIDDSVFCDRTLAFQQKFDETGRKTSEWQIYKSVFSEKTDTNYVLLDSIGRQQVFRGFGSKTTYEYSEYDMPTKSIIKFDDKSRDSIIITSNYALDSSRRIVQEKQLHKNGTIEYNYLWNGTHKEKRLYGQLITKEIVNAQGEWIMLENYGYEIGELTSRFIRIIDDSNRVHYYVKYQGGVLIKESEHFYKENYQEKKMIEYFPADGIIIETTFEYEYW